MFDRFTERARKVMTVARQEALRLNHDYVGTEHLLLGLSSDSGGVAAQVIKNLGVEHSRIRAETERLVEIGSKKVTAKVLPFTPRVKRVLEFALEESQELLHNHIGTEHLLLGLIREKDGPAANVLESLGVRVEDVRDEIVEVIASGPPKPLDPEALDLEREVRAAILDRFPPGTVGYETERRRTSRGEGLSVLIAWTPDAGKRPLASVTLVAPSADSLRAQLPAALETLAGLMGEMKKV